MTRAITLAGYAALLTLAIACEAVARRTGRVAPLARTAAVMARWRPVWMLVLAAWLWFGWHVFVRVDR
jgi:hypothetical protein